MSNYQTAVRRVLAPVTLFYGALSALCWILLGFHFHATLKTGVLMPAFGLLLWTLLEYVMHRFVLHSHRSLGPIERWHGHKIHHKAPDDLLEIAYPVLYSMPIAAGLIGLLYAATHDWAMTVAILPGLFAGYIYYEWVHFGCHYWKPRNALFRWQVKNHFHHHYKSPRQRYGVTNPLWDAIFFTR